VIFVEENGEDAGVQTEKVVSLSDLTDFLNQRDRDYCIGMISSRWWARGANV
jgi:hypothetical protein